MEAQKRHEDSLDDVAGDYVALMDSPSAKDSEFLEFCKNDVIEIVDRGEKHDYLRGRLDDSVGLVSPRRVVRRRLRPLFSASAIDDSRHSATPTFDTKPKTEVVPAKSKRISFRLRQSWMFSTDKMDRRFLAFEVGDRVEVLQTDHPSGYWVCALHGELGLVRPASLVRLEQESIYEAVALGDTPLKAEGALKVFKGQTLEVLEEEHPSGKMAAKREGAVGLVDPEWIVRKEKDSKFHCVALSGFDNVSDQRILHFTKGDFVSVISDNHVTQWWVGAVRGVVGLVCPRKLARLDLEPIFECAALCDWKADNGAVDEDLSFLEGDVLVVLEESHPSPKWVARHRDDPSVALGLVSPQHVVRLSVPKFAARALVDFDGAEAVDLAFRAGDLIEVMQDHYLRRTDWWVGRLCGKYGVVDVEMVVLE